MNRISRLLKTSVQSDMDDIFLAINKVADALIEKQIELAEQELFELKVVLNELFFNAAKHGNEWDNEKLVKINIFLINADNILICVEDQGLGYNHGLVADSIFCDNVFDDMKECGRGLLIVRNLCSTVRINKSGNRIMALKKMCLRSECS